MWSQHDELAREFADKISAGDIKPGDRLPSSTQLAADRNISASTARLAYNLLSAAGLITSRQGSGTFVREPMPQVIRDANQRYAAEKARAWEGDSDELDRVIAELDSDDVERSDVQITAAFAQAPASDDLAERFGVEAGALLLERVFETTISRQGDHMNIIRSYIPLALVNGEQLDEANKPCPGVEIDRIVDEIASRPPTLAEIEHLGLGQGVAVFELMKTSIDTTGRVVEIAIAVYPGDRTSLRYTTQLDRWPK